MEDVNYLLLIYYPVPAKFSKNVPASMTPGEKQRHAVNDSPRILHSSPAEEKKLGFPFSENGPSDIQGEAATAPFSDLGEWSESAMTTPNIDRLWCLITNSLSQYA
jgi:hypothetical protein